MFYSQAAVLPASKVLLHSGKSRCFSFPINSREILDVTAHAEQAIRECIAEGVPKDFLEKHRAEAKEMSIFEYDQEKHMRQEREDAWADGHSAGREEMLITQIRKKLAKGKSVEVIADELEESEERIREMIDKIRQEEA